MRTHYKKITNPGLNCGKDIVCKNFARSKIRPIRGLFLRTLQQDESLDETSEVQACVRLS